MRMRCQIKNVRQDQRGFASIVIALVLIIVLSLLTVAFAHLARREQQGALDKQLASQAEYAAETGINDIVKRLPTIPVTNNANVCLDASTTPVGDPTKGVSYTCALVNKQPPNMKWDNIAANAKRYISFSTDLTAGSFEINWGSAHNTSPVFPANISGLQPLATWGSNRYPAVLQVSVTPLNAVDRDSLIKNTFTVYMYPSKNGANNASYSTVSAQQAPIISGNCDIAANGKDYPCKAAITNLTNGTGPYLVRIVNYYDNSNVLVNGQCVNAAASPVPCKFDGQPQIDVTGQAKNVLKRLQVRVTSHAISGLPDDALEVGSLCKRFSVYPGTATPDPLDNSCKFD